MSIAEFTPQAEMKKIGKRDIVLTLLEELTGNSIEPDEFTIADYIEIAESEGKKISYGGAKDRLSKLEKAGVLEKRKIVVNSTIANVYRKK